MSSTQTGPIFEAEIAVVGAGAAGLYAALCAAREGASVVLISATPLAQTASYWAQGGLAAALAADDSFALHLADTERAGRALVRRSAAEILVREAPDELEILLPDTNRIVVKTANVEERRRTAVSPMPSGLVKTPAELRDLITYLLADRVVPP